MADNFTTTSIITPAVNAYFNKLLLVRNKPRLVHGLFADREVLPAGMGKTIVWRRFAQLATATTEILEGITPPGKYLSKQDIRATVAQYMDFIHITDVLEFTCESKILNVGVSELNDQMFRTEDELIRNVIVSTASTVTASNGDPTTTALNETDIDAVANTLQNNDSHPVTPLIRASTGQGTSPVLPSYWAIMNTALNKDLRVVTGFMNTSEYAQQGTVLEAERGSVNEVRFLASSVAHKEGSASEAFPTNAGSYFYVPIIARHGYGIVTLEKANAKLIIHPRGSAGSMDPGDQRQTAAWKFMNVCRILNDNNIIVLKVTAA